MGVAKVRPTVYIWLAAAAFGQSAAAADVSFGDLSVVDQTPNGPDQRRLLQPTDQRSATWLLSGARSSSEASFKARYKDRITAQAVALDGYSGSASAGVWFADVVTFSVAGAGPKAMKKISTIVGMGHISREGGHDDDLVSAYFCVGSQDCSALSPPDGVMAGFDLPPPSGLVEPVIGGDARQNDNESGFASEIVFTIRGAVAVVPIVAHFAVAATQASGDGTEMISGTYRWELRLPAGVTCSSRSGMAFGGLCPAGAR